jgi:hypothetical protein
MTDLSIFTPEEVADARQVVERMPDTLRTRIRQHAAIAHSGGLSIVEAYQEAATVVEATARRLGWSEAEVAPIHMMVAAVMCVDVATAQAA